MSDIVEKLTTLENVCPTSDWTQINLAGKAAIAEARREIERLRADIEKLKDPNVVHLGMLSGGIAKPNWKQIEHLYPEEIERLRGELEDAKLIIGRGMIEAAKLRGQVEQLTADNEKMLMMLRGSGQPRNSPITSTMREPTESK